MTPTLQADPDCARPPTAPAPAPAPASPAPAASAEEGAGGRDDSTAIGAATSLIAERRAFADIVPATWDELAARNPYATPFSSWAFHRAWWDAYGDNAHDETLVVLEPTSGGPTAGATPTDSRRIVAIVPLMDRHVVEPTDAETHTVLRHGQSLPLTPVPASACAIYFGASYHADYATILAHPADLPAVGQAITDALTRDVLTPPPGPADPDHPERWSIVDLRRLRLADPATDALATAFGRLETAEGWTLDIEREDVCPVIHIPDGATDIDAVLTTLGKKERHEIRRKVRRAEAAGLVELVESTDPMADLDAFIDLHQARWGERGLFPSTVGGDQSRTFVRRLFELFGAVARPADVAGASAMPDGGPAARPAGPTIHLGFLTVGGRRVAGEIHFETPGSILYYNAGTDLEASSLSPGVLLLERLVRRAIERGKCRVDLLRGDEPYKYEWGAIDEPIQRILLRRSA